MSKSKTFACDQHASNILSKLHTFYRNQLFFDIALTTKTDNCKVHAHRAVLSASSDYFLAMLCSTLKEARSDVIQLEIDGATLKAVVDFMYSGTIELSSANIARILVAADVLKMSTLKVLCSEFIGETIDTTNFLENGPERETLGFLSGKTTYHLTMEYFEPESNMWTSEDLPPSPTKRSDYKAMLIDKKLIVAGGSTNIVECLDLRTKEWTNLPPMRQPRTIPGMAELNGDLYVVGGELSDSWSKRSMEKYDFRTREWQKLPSISKEGRVNVTVLGELIYAVVEGEVDIECFNPADSKWTQLPHRNERSTCFGIAGVGGYLYAVGGNYNGYPSKTVERFNPLTNTWTVISPGLARALYSLKCISWNNRLIAFCGMNKGVENSVVEYNPDENDWMKLASLVRHDLYYNGSLFTIAK